MAEVVNKVGEAAARRQALAAERRQRVESRDLNEAQQKDHEAKAREHINARFQDKARIEQIDKEDAILAQAIGSAEVKQAVEAEITATVKTRQEVEQMKKELADLIANEKARQQTPTPTP